MLNGDIMVELDGNPTWSKVFDLHGHSGEQILLSNHSVGNTDRGEEGQWRHVDPEIWDERQLKLFQEDIYSRNLLSLFDKLCSASTLSEIDTDSSKHHQLHEREKFYCGLRITQIWLGSTRSI